MNYENNKTKIHGILFILVIILYIFSPDTGLKMGNENVWGKEVSNTTETSSGKMEKTISTSFVSSGTQSKDNEKQEGNEGEDKKYGENNKRGGGNDIKNTVLQTCNAECKINTLTGIGIRPEIAESLVVNCKAMAENPILCIKVGASILTAESSKGYKCKKSNPYNCFGMAVNEDYKSYNDAVVHFVGKWNRWWYKAKDMTHFYSPAGKLPPTRFCVSEESTGTEIGCPAGLRNSSSTFNKLKW